MEFMLWSYKLPTKAVSLHESDKLHDTSLTQDEDFNPSSSSSEGEEEEEGAAGSGQQPSAKRKRAGSSSIGDGGGGSSEAAGGPSTWLATWLGQQCAAAKTTLRTRGCQCLTLWDKKHLSAVPGNLVVLDYR